MQLVRIISSEIEPFGKTKGVRITFELAGKVQKVVLFDKDPLYTDATALVPNDELEFDMEKNEKNFWVLKSIGPVINSVGAEPLAPTGPVSVEAVKLKGISYSDQQADQRKSIERQTSLKAAVELVVGSGIKFKTISDAYAETIFIAEGFYDFITKGPDVCEKSTEEQ